MRQLVSHQHFTVDGTLIGAWAGNRSLKKKDDDDDSRPGATGRDPDADFRGERRSDKTHESTTDPASRLAKKGAGKEAFGRAKTVGLLRKTRHRGRRLVGWIFCFTTAIYKLVRIRNLDLAAV